MFSIVLPIYDPRDRCVPSGALPEAVRSALALEGSFELILVNNNRIEETPRLSEYLRSVAADRPRQVKLSEPNRNAGTAGGFNLGLALSRPDHPYLVFLSADAEMVDPSMLVKIEEDLRARSDVGAAHPFSAFEDIESFNVPRFGLRTFYRRMAASDDSGDLSREEIAGILARVGRRAGVTTSYRSFPLTFAVLRRSALEMAGSFDEGFRTVCHENDDLAFRFLRKGWGIGRLERVFVNHRRTLFRRLSSAGPAEGPGVPHADGLRQSTQWWKEKWGKPYPEAYLEWRFGPGVAAAARPYFWLRGIGSAMRRILIERQLRGNR